MTKNIDTNYENIPSIELVLKCHTEPRWAAGKIKYLESEIKKIKRMAQNRIEND